MELEKPKIQTFSREQVNYIKSYCPRVGSGSEVNCYRLSFNEIIKIFNKSTVPDPSIKLFLPDNIYGTNTFIFVNAIQMYCKKIYSYTMKYIKGAKLGGNEAITVFYNLSYNMLLEYIETLIKDCKSTANNGIEAFDCFMSNIILTDTGFKQIDCVDFILKDQDPKITEKENIRLMCQTIYDCLLAPYLSTFINNVGLNPKDFCSYPDEFIKELRRISQEYSDTEIITLADTRQLSRKK